MHDSKGQPMAYKMVFNIKLDNSLRWKALTLLWKWIDQVDSWQHPESIYEFEWTLPIHSMFEEKLPIPVCET